LLRITLQSNGINEVSLREEIDFLKVYLEIEQARMGKRLTVTIQDRSRHLDCASPQSPVQPLVEMRFGTALRRMQRAVKSPFSSTREKGSLRLLVRDTGPGLASAEVPARRRWPGEYPRRACVSFTAPARASS
jgi:LytS/YehU family sensor histidine kinase